MYLTIDANVETTISYITVVNVTLILVFVLLSIGEYETPTISLHNDYKNMNKQVKNLDAKMEKIYNSNIEIIDLLKKK